jgi:hypothetical protein
MATGMDAATLDPHVTNALFTFLVVHQVHEGQTWPSRCSCATTAPSMRISRIAISGLAPPLPSPQRAGR